MGLLFLNFILLIVVILGSFFYWRMYQFNKEILVAKEQLQLALNVASSTIASTTSQWQLELERNNNLSEQVYGLATSVQTLDKLSKTDRELLKKYSKVYFLSEHYVPERLATITPDLLYPERKDLRIHSSILDHLERMLVSASSSGQKLLVVSAYRSFGEQSALKNGYKVNYGSGANKFSADQGYSEHQLGTTVDLSLKQLPATSLKFGETEAYKWLLANAHHYGFVLSYPPNNSYYQYEPWHWRFVGISLATKLKDENKYFYNYPQRLIDNYLVTIFD